MGLSKVQITDLKHETVGEGLWSEKERALIDLIDGLVKNIEVAQPVFEEVRRYFEEAELIELVQIIGLYTGVAMMVALAKPELDHYR